MSFAAKKSLGQHFLHAPNVVGAMVHAARIGKGTSRASSASETTGASGGTGMIDADAIGTVLEIGPGKGVLTQGLLKTGANVIAVEKDPRSVAFLREKFADEIGRGDLTLVEKDILETEPRDLGLEQGNYALAANIPYYITGEILRKFLTARDQPARMVLLVQKEVAKRIVAADGKESLLSISVKAYGEPNYLETVPKRFFRPMPGVDSALISIENINKSFFERGTANEESFFSMVRAGFAHKRKILKRNLQGIIPGQALEKLWTEKKWPPALRAEEVSLDQWRELAKFAFFSTEN